MINTINKKYKEYFDQIFCLEISEYLFDPIIALKNLNNLLKINGILWMSFCFLYPVHQPIENDNLRYTKAGIIKLLTEAGFKVDYIKSRKMKSESYKFYQQFLKSEGMHASKQYHDHDDIGYLVRAIKI